MVTYLLLTKRYPIKYQREYAQKALDQKPNDYHTLYVWTLAQTDPTNREQGYSKLLKLNPNFTKGDLQ